MRFVLFIASVTLSSHVMGIPYPQTAINQAQHQHTMHRPCPKSLTSHR